MTKTVKFFKTFGFLSLCVFWAALTFSNALVEITFVCALVSWIAVRFLSRSSAVSASLPKSLWLPLAGFVLISFLSCFWSEYPPQSLRGIFKVFQQVMVFFIVIDLFHDAKDLRRFEAVFVGVFALVLADCFYQLCFGKDFLRGFSMKEITAGVRVSGGFKTYGQLASYFASTLPFMAALGWRCFRDKKDKVRIALYGAAVASGLVLFYLTRSRGAFLAFSLGFVLFLILRRNLLLIGAFLLILAGGIILLPRDMILHRDIEGKEQSLVERVHLWDRALQVIRAKPWGGTGINTYAAAHAKYDQTQSWRVKGYYAHNGYLQLGAETGIPSLILFMLFFIQYFRFSLRRLWSGALPHIRDRSLGLLIGIFNFMVICLVDTSLHNLQPVLTFWFLVALQWLYSEISYPETSGRLS